MIRGEVAGRLIGPASELDGDPFGPRTERQAVTASLDGQHPRALLVCQRGRFDRVLAEAEEGARFKAEGDMLLAVWFNPATGQHKPRLTVRVTRLRLLDRRRDPAVIEQQDAMAEQAGDGAGHDREGSVPILPAQGCDTAPALLAQKSEDSL